MIAVDGWTGCDRRGRGRVAVVVARRVGAYARRTCLLWREAAAVRLDVLDQVAND